MGSNRGFWRGLAVCGALLWCGIGWSSLVLPPGTGYWGGYNNLLEHLGTSALVTGITPDDTLDDPGPAGEMGKAGVVIFTRPGHRDMVASVLQDHYQIPRTYGGSDMLSVPVTVRGAELAERTGRLRTRGWKSVDLNLMASDYELLGADGRVERVLPSGGCFFNWGDAAHLPQDADGLSRVKLLGTPVLLADTLVPHDPSSPVVARRRPFFLARALTPADRIPHVPQIDPVDGVELLRAVVGTSPAVLFVTPDFRPGQEPGAILLTLSTINPEQLRDFVRPHFSFKGINYTVHTRKRELDAKASGRLQKKGADYVLVDGATVLPVQFSPHWSAEYLQGLLAREKPVNIEGYTELVNGTSVFFAVYMNEVESVRAP
jgi:hypothetical protein